MADESNSSASMVQQLADVAQSARELLAMENIGDGIVKEEAGEDEEEEEGNDDGEEHRMEEDEIEKEEDVANGIEQSIATQSFDPLGHILMLGLTICGNDGIKLFINTVGLNFKIQLKIVEVAPK